MKSSHIDINKAYTNLANGIVIQAVDDYRRLLRGKPIQGNLKGYVSIKECEKFFLSEWFYILTNVDGQTILDRLRREYADECKARARNT